MIGEEGPVSLSQAAYIQILLDIYAQNSQFQEKILDYFLHSDEAKLFDLDVPPVTHATKQENKNKSFEYELLANFFETIPDNLQLALWFAQKSQRLANIYDGNKELNARRLQLLALIELLVRHSIYELKITFPILYLKDLVSYTLKFFFSDSIFILASIARDSTASHTDLSAKKSLINYFSCIKTDILQSPDNTFKEIVTKLSADLTLNKRNKFEFFSLIDNFNFSYFDPYLQRHRNVLANIIELCLSIHGTLRWPQKKKT